MSGHWDDTIIKESVSATFMTPFFFLDPSSLGNGMTGEGTAVIKEPVSATWMIPFST